MFLVHVCFAVDVFLSHFCLFISMRLSWCVVINPSLSVLTLAGLEWQANTPVNIHYDTYGQYALTDTYTRTYIQIHMKNTPKQMHTYIRTYIQMRTNNTSIHIRTYMRTYIQHTLKYTWAIRLNKCTHTYVHMYRCILVIH